MNPWRKYTIEFIVIIVSILLSFLVEEWRENAADRDRNLKFLQRISNDLASDLVALQHCHMVSRMASDANDSLLSGMDGNPIPEDSIHLYITRAMFHIPLQLRTANYESIKNTGVIYTFSDTLVDALIRHYENDYAELRYYADEIYEIEHRDIYPIICQTYDLSNSPFLGFRTQTRPNPDTQALMHDLHFRNQLLLMRFIRHHTHCLIQMCMENAELLQLLIGQELMK